MRYHGICCCTYYDSFVIQYNKGRWQMRLCYGIQNLTLKVVLQNSVCMFSYCCLFRKRQFFLWLSAICLPSVLQGFCITQHELPSATVMIWARFIASLISFWKLGEHTCSVERDYMLVLTRWLAGHSLLKGYFCIHQYLRHNWCYLHTAHFIRHERTKMN